MDSLLLLIAKMSSAAGKARYYVVDLRVGTTGSELNNMNQLSQTTTNHSMVEDTDIPIQG